MANTKLPARLLDTSAIPALNVTGDLTVDTTTLKVDSTNNRVGIGVVSPSSTLDIRGSGNVDMMSKIINTQQTSSGRKTEFLFGKDNGANLSGVLKYVYDTTQASRRIDLIHYQTTNGISILDGGNVGIGENNPARRLTVKSAGANATQISLVDNDSTNEVFAVGQQSDGDGFLTLKQDDGTTKVLFDASGDSYVAGGSLHIGSTDSITSSAEIFSVYNASTGHSKMVNNSDSYGTLYIHNESTTANTWQPFIIMQKGGGNRGNIGVRHSDSLLGLHGQGGIDLKTSSTSLQAATTRMKILSNGNVGIGSTDAAYALEVKKSVNSDWLSRIYNTGTTDASGLLVRSDTADSQATTIFGVYGGGSYKMFVKGDGSVTQPKQPTAIYTHSANTEDGAYNYTYAGTGARSVIAKPQTAVVNRGSIYNPSTGRFTAPQAGVYRYAVHGNLYTSGLVASAYWTWRIYKNTSHYIYHYESNSTRAANGWVYCNAAGIIEMAANDYLRFEIKTNNLSSTTGFGMDLSNYTHYEFQLLY